MLILFIAAAALQAGESSTYSRPSTSDLIEAFKEIESRPKPPNAGDVLYRELRKMHGKPARVAFNRIGYPDKKMNIEGATVYSWVNEDTNLDGSPLRCTVKVIVRKGLIASTDFRGNEGACATYARALDASYRLR